MLVVNPEGCFDCGVREPECPIKAIFADAQPGLKGWLKLNGKTPRSDQTLRSNVNSLLTLKFLSPNPGQAIDEGKSSEKQARVPDHD